MGKPRNSWEEKNNEQPRIVFPNLSGQDSAFISSNILGPDIIQQIDVVFGHL